MRLRLLFLLAKPFAISLYGRKKVQIDTVQYVEMECGPYALNIEYRWINSERTDAPIAVFLHEGLGSVALWKDWPQTLCDRLNCRGLVYSRPGYGQSTPRQREEKWSVNFLHHQACDVLPALLNKLDIDVVDRSRMRLIGHSDGGTIALLYAAAFPDSLAGLAILAPHVFVETMTVDAIRQARIAYENGALRNRLAAYHRDVDSAFYGWNDVWLNPAFLEWDITDELTTIKRPLLAIQGYEDEYASMLQIDKIKAAVHHAQLLKLPACGHSPHRDASHTVNDAIAQFFMADEI